MTLELGHIQIKDMVFGPRTEIVDSTLSVARDELRDFLRGRDDRITALDISLAKPGEATRIICVKDVIEPRCKVDREKCGQGRVHILDNAAVVTCGKIVGFQEGIIDMSGPGAAHTPFSKTFNLVLEIEVSAGLEPHQHEEVVRLAGLQAADFLGEAGRTAYPPMLVEGAKGPGLLLEKLFPQIAISHTLIFGDNYLAGDTTAGLARIHDLLAPLFSDKHKQPELVLAGPAFNAGRYGLGCGAICKAIQEDFNIPAVTAMYPDNPGVDQFRRDIFIAQSAENVIGMEDGVRKMVSLGLKLVRREKVNPGEDDYIPQGRRQNVFADRTGARRAVDMLLQKIAGKPFVTEYPMPVFDRVEPAPPIKDIRQARLALVTSGGIVPLGNPDRIEAANAQRFGAYPLQGPDPADAGAI